MTILESSFKSTKKGNRRAGQPKGARLGYDDSMPSGRSGAIEADARHLWEEMEDDKDLEYADRVVEELRSAQRLISKILGAQKQRGG